VRKYKYKDLKCIDCGKVRSVLVDNIRKGACLRCMDCSQKRRVASMTKHGGSVRNKDNRVYFAWWKMKERCTNSNSKDFRDYGGRGIGVADRWLDFGNFLQDMGSRPEGKSLGRIDNDGDYSPENCRWESIDEQSANKRSTIYIDFRGERIALIEAVRKFSSVGYHTARMRIRNGWDHTKAITTESLRKTPTTQQGN
jgi:hypothetical protein